MITAAKNFSRALHMSASMRTRPSMMIAVAVAARSMKLKTLITIATTAYTVTLPLLSHGGMIITDDFSVNQVGATTAGGTITPQYSMYNTVWTVNSGTFATNGASIGNYLPTAGYLNFGVDAGTAITLPFGTGVQPGEATMSFDLAQSNGSDTYVRFDLSVTDNADKSYFITMSPNAGYFGTSGFAAFDQNFNVLVVGASGTKLDAAGWQTISLAFDPVSGFTLTKGESTILTFANTYSSTYLKSLQFATVGGGVSWFVDNVNVTAVPEPSSLVMLGIGAIALLRRRR